jgi:hypothetical protein
MINFGNILAVSGLIDTVYATGDDALGNQAEMSIGEISSIFQMKDPLKVRITIIDIPAYTVGKYTIDYKTQKFTKPSGKIETPNEMTFSFRSDKYWTIYQALLAWKRYIADEDSGAMAEDVGALTGTSSFRTNVIVHTIDSNDVVTYTGWKFEKAWISDLQGINFDQSNGEPIIVQGTLDFVKMIPASVI